jgi:putative ABC transport system permease protein
VRSIRRLAARAAALCRRQRLERELDEELRDHREMDIEDGVARGMSRDHARQAAYRNLGHTHTIKELWRDAKGFTAVDELVQDVRYAVRSLRRAPGFTLVAVVTLGLAIGVNAGVFSVVDAVLLNPLPFQEPDRLVSIAASAPGTDVTGEFRPTPDFYLQYRDRADLLEDIGAYSWFTSTLRVGDRVERVPMSAVTPSVFSTLGVSPILGRLPAPEDQDRVAVISHATWLNWFGADPAVIGRAYDIRNAQRTVIGVMGPEFGFPHERVLLWYPAPIREAEIVPGRGGRSLVGRMAPGVEHADVRRQLDSVAAGLPERFGGSPEYVNLVEHHRAVVRSLEEQLVGFVSGTLWVLLGSVGIVLLVACANVANLFLVRGESRQRDFAVRRAIGAGRVQLIRSQMTEAIVVAGMGGASALFLAWLGVPLFLQVAPTNIPRIGDVGLHDATLVFTVVASMFAAVACGLIPALRSSGPAPIRLRESGRGTTRRRHWGRDGLVVAQTAMALVLLVGSGLLVRSYWELRNVDPGYNLDDVLTFMIAPSGPHLTDGPSYAEFHLTFMAHVAQIPRVESVGIVENLPLVERVGQWRVRTPDMTGPEGAGLMVRRTWTGGRYFEAMGIALLRGRAFADDDHRSQLGNTIVSRSAAELLWPGEDPIGRRLRSDATTPWQTVVGMVADVKQDSFRDTAEPVVYQALVGPTPASWVIASPGYAVKTSAPDLVVPQVQALVHDMAPNSPMYRVSTMRTLAADTMAQLSFIMLTLGIASVLTLVLGALGLYGVLSYVVAQRTQEIGVRLALGARAHQIHRMVVGQGARVVVLGVGLGVIVASGATRALGSFLFEFEAVDTATFFMMSAAMLCVGLLASYLPARRASNVDPIESLRE